MPVDWIESSLTLYERRARLDGCVIAKNGGLIKSLPSVSGSVLRDQSWRTFFNSLLARTLHEGRREAFKTEAHRGCSQGARRDE